MSKYVQEYKYEIFSWYFYCRKQEYNILANLRGIHLARGLIFYYNSDHSVQQSSKFPDSSVDLFSR